MPVLLSFDVCSRASLMKTLKRIGHTIAKERKSNASLCSKARIGSVNDLFLRCFILGGIFCERSSKGLAKNDVVKRDDVKLATVRKR